MLDTQFYYWIHDTFLNKRINNLTQVVNIPSVGVGRRVYGVNFLLQRCQVVGQLRDHVHRGGVGQFRYYLFQDRYVQSLQELNLDVQKYK